MSNVCIRRPSFPTPKIACIPFSDSVSYGNRQPCLLCRDTSEPGCTDEHEDRSQFVTRLKNVFVRATAMPDNHHAMLQRYLNGRMVSFHLDRLLSAFEPFHSGIVDPSGTVPLRFPGYAVSYELRLGSSAVASGVTFTLNLRLPIEAPGFWFCVHCLMRDDYVALLAQSAHGIFYAHPETPSHAPNFGSHGDTTFADVMTRIEHAAELVAMFADSENGG